MSPISRLLRVYILETLCWPGSITILSSGCNCIGLIQQVPVVTLTSNTGNRHGLMWYKIRDHHLRVHQLQPVHADFNTREACSWQLNVICSEGHQAKMNTVNILHWSAWSVDHMQFIVNQRLYTTTRSEMQCHVWGMCRWYYYTNIGQSLHINIQKHEEVKYWKYSTLHKDKYLHTHTLIQWFST